MRLASGALARLSGAIGTQRRRGAAREGKLCGPVHGKFGQVVDEGAIITWYGARARLCFPTLGLALARFAAAPQLVQVPDHPIVKRSIAAQL